MRRGTTPTEVYTITNPEQTVDLSYCTQVWVTITDRAGHDFTFDIDRLVLDTANNKVELTLTQEETLAFAVGTARAQLRFLEDDGTAFASKPVSFPIDDVRKGGVISNE